MTTTRTEALALIKTAKRWLRCQVGRDGYLCGLYLIDGGRICPECAREQWADIVRDTLHSGPDRGWGILGIDAHWEGKAEFCDCGEVFESEDQKRKWKG